MTTDTYVLERQYLPAADLDRLHRAENQACLADNPGDPFSREHPLWTLNEEHRLEWMARTAIETQVQNAAKREAEREAKRSTTTERHERAQRLSTDARTEIATRPRTCLDCGGEIPPTGKRGRPPTRCPECREIFEAAQVSDTPKSCGACARGGKGRHLNSCPKRKAN